MDPEFSRSVSFNVPVPDYTALAHEVVFAFGAAVAEAQLLEDALKTAIRMDVGAFVEPAAIPDLLSELSTITLGGTIKIADGSASRTPAQQIMSRIVGFAQLLPSLSGFPPARLSAKLKDALQRRNAIAHHYLVDVIHGNISSADATSYLGESRAVFAELKKVILVADFTSSKLGAVAPDGSSLPRVPKL